MCKILQYSELEYSFSEDKPHWFEIQGASTLCEQKLFLSSVYKLGSVATSTQSKYIIIMRLYKFLNMIMTLIWTQYHVKS